MLDTHAIDIAGDIIKRESQVRYLGAFICETVSFKEHVKRKCRSAMINYLRIKYAKVPYESCYRNSSIVSNFPSRLL
jgi:hypothetical protein